MTPAIRHGLCGTLMVLIMDDGAGLWRMGNKMAWDNIQRWARIGILDEVVHHDVSYLRTHMAMFCRLMIRIKYPSLSFSRMKLIKEMKEFLSIAL